MEHTTLKIEKELFNSEIHVEVADDLTEEPPEELVEAVHEVLVDTIGHLMDGHTIKWKTYERGWRLVFMQSLPEMYVSGEDGEFGCLPPYRTGEKFEGADGKGDGLLTNLPDGWGFEIERQGVYDFYQE